MAYIALNPEAYNNQCVGTGQCVAFVQKASGAPATSLWKQGTKVRGNLGVRKGTAIATFEANGKYGNTMDSTSHGAIFVGQNAAGLQVWDQWIGQRVHQRTIPYRGGAPGVKPVNDGDAFYVIE
ncbi:MAG: BPSL0067 family protein [Acidobacteriaceae bacterium]